jgi:hypothetical protein
VILLRGYSTFGVEFDESYQQVCMIVVDGEGVQQQGTQNHLAQGWVPFLLGLLDV